MRRHAAGDPAPTARPRKRTDWGTVQQLWPYMWAYKWRVVLAIACLVGAKVANVGVPLVLKKLIDGLTPLLNSQAALAAAAMPVALLLAYGALRLSTTVFTELRELLFARVTQNAVRAIAIQVFDYLHALSLRFHLNRQTGGVTRDIERGSRAISSLVSYTLYSILPTLIEIVLVVGYLFLNYEIWFSVITATALVLYIVFTVKITEWRLQFRRNMNELDSKANVRAVDSLINYETVKYFGNERFESDRYNKSMTAWQEAAIASQKSLSLLNTGQSAIIALAVTAVLWRATVGVLNGSMTLGDLVLVNAFMIQLYIPLNFLGVIYREIKQSLADIERMFGLLDEHQEVQDKPGAPELAVQGGAIEFRNVSFAYDERRVVIKDLSFNVPAGQTVAVVGHSGAGKSTLSRLLYRFYEVSDGDIRIDGQDIREVQQVSLRKSIGIVPQDTVLFNDTIAYNIAYGRPGATQSDVERAAKAAHIHHFIETLPDGYQTPVGERGLKLSGGEKQRVAIARTILKNPAILIFDEATSALDSHSEQAIQQELRELSRNRTTLIIAHRLSTIVHADQILVMSQGELIERGSHQELLDKGGAYARMWATQQHQQLELSDDGNQMA
ncbi:ABC transporter ATP-binding protein/permease [Limnobacter humi]|uniref:ABC transporter ATP-binding protein/permease n=1 Tax=Limnobacter humi TaxID=1778671 RepID=A0ABT1WCF5_9BURK|nr:ABC transporter ATP-binding protein/permease [Limnobacter humi]MCQ8895197.1 ABC transporter ATP-binding protein/permease [Limnobacter humi]